MKLTNAQNKYINNKYLGRQILRGKSNTGKTTASLHRLVNLKNNYSLRDDDRLLYISYEDKSLNNISKEFRNIDSKKEYISLFSFIENKVDFYNMDNLIDKYFYSFDTSKAYKNRDIDKDECMKIIEEIIFKFNIDKKIIRKYSIEFIYNEIMWIKSSYFTKSEYLLVERKGREKRLNKSGEIRKLLYRIYNEYNKYVDDNKLLDKYHKIYFILNNKDLIQDKYIHIVLDECREYTLGEIRFIRIIIKGNESSITYIMGDEISSREYVWMSKGRKLKDVDDVKCKSYILKEKIKKEEILNLTEYKYIDLRGRANFSFYKDYMEANDSIMVKEDDNLIDLNKEELQSIPVFNEIAAGEPILINPSIEDVFYMPSYFSKSNGDKFILKVKGDSMENINIKDGDMVLIKRQSTAVNNDVVAVDIDGSATLKTLKISKERIYLKPENSKYDIINLEDKDATVLGVALGVIKDNG